MFSFEFEVEHILPRSQGGATSSENLALACRACNIHKSDTEFALDSITQSECRLFNPRIDNWADHFEVNTETLEIVGKTPTGRVTVQVLRMNRPMHVTARRRWAALGLFP